MTDDRHEDQTRRPVDATGFMALSGGTRLGGRYAIDHVIAHGGFGITYGARHLSLGRMVAIKEHFPRQFAYRDGATSEVRPSNPATFTWALDRFLQEGRALVACEHPNVVRVSDIFEENGTAYMVLGYEDGISLKSWLDRLGRAPTQAEIDRILMPLLDALHYIHGQGLLHRDIAPDNIMIRRDGSPCLIDFGAARQAIAERSQAMSAIVKTGFSPPEQYTSSGRAQGPWTDIYALGATVYRSLTGGIPLEATERMLEDTLRPAREAVTSPETYRPGFLEAIDAALRLKAVERPQTVAAWRDQLAGTATVAIAPASATPAVPGRVTISPASPVARHAHAAEADAEVRTARPRRSGQVKWLVAASLGVVALGSMMALSSQFRAVPPTPPPTPPKAEPAAPALPPTTSKQTEPTAIKPPDLIFVPATPPPSAPPAVTPDDLAKRKQLEDLEYAQRKAAADRKIAEDRAAQLKAEDEARKLADEKAVREDATACHRLDETQCKANTRCSWVVSTVFIEGRPANPSYCGPVGSRPRGVTYQRK